MAGNDLLLIIDSEKTLTVQDIQKQIHDQGIHLNIEQSTIFLSIYDMYYGMLNRYANILNIPTTKASILSIPMSYYSYLQYEISIHGHDWVDNHLNAIGRLGLSSVAFSSGVAVGSLAGGIALPIIVGLISSISIDSITIDNKYLYDHIKDFIAEGKDKVYDIYEDFITKNQINDLILFPLVEISQEGFIPGFNIDVFTYYKNLELRGSLLILNELINLQPKTSHLDSTKLNITEEIENNDKLDISLNNFGNLFEESDFYLYG